MIHYKSIKHPNYPSTPCGKNLIAMEFTDDKGSVTCLMCIASLNRNVREIKGKGKNK